MNATLGKLVIISGPSGVGKSTVVRQLIETCDLPLELSVSATTRPIRPGEVNGVNYWFMTNDEFQEQVQSNKFLEYVEVFGRGHWYGTLQEQVQQGLNDGKWIILEIDVEGAGRVINQHHDAVTVFIHPGSLEELERRLRHRGTETEEAIRRRLEVASGELAVAQSYQHIIVNQDVATCVSDICETLKSTANLNSGGNPECTKN